MNSTLYVAHHEGQEFKRRSSRQYRYAVIARHTPEVQERLKATWIGAFPTWHLVRWTSRMDLAEDEVARMFDRHRGHHSNPHYWWAEAKIIECKPWDETQQSTLKE